MIINIDGGNGGGGGGYVLPIASASVLGGVKVGSGLTIDNAGRLSTSGGSAAEAFSVTISSFMSEDWTQDDFDALQDMADYLSGKTEMVSAYVDAVSTNEGELGEAERFYINYFDGQGAVFYYTENTMLYELYINFEDVEQSAVYMYQFTTGGTSDSNYVIVDDLGDIDNPTDGLMAWVRTASAVSSTYKIYISDPQDWDGWDGDRPEGMIGHFTDGESENLNLYLSSENFHWDWENDGEWHARQYDEYTIYYRTHNVDATGGAWFEVEPLPEGVSFEASSGVSMDAITSVTYSNGVSYVYRKGDWKQLNATYLVDRFNFADSAETVAFYEQIQRDLDAGNIPVIYEINRKITLTYAGEEYNGAKFYGSLWNDAAQITFAGPNGYFDSEGFNPEGIKWDEGNIAPSRGQIEIEITSGGTFNNPDQIGQFGAENQTDAIIFKMNGDYASWSQAPVKYVYRTRSQEEDPLVYHFAVEIPVNGTLYRGVWHVTENDWSNYTTDSWAAV